MHFAWRILLASLRHQRARLGIAALAMALGSALVSGDPPIWIQPTTPGQLFLSTATRSANSASKHTQRASEFSRMDGERFTDTSSGIVEEKQQGAIPLCVWRSRIDGGNNGACFLWLEIRDHALR